MQILKDTEKVGSKTDSLKAEWTYKAQSQNDNDAIYLLIYVVYLRQDSAKSAQKSFVELRYKSICFDRIFLRCKISTGVSERAWLFRDNWMHSGDSRVTE